MHATKLHRWKKAQAQRRLGPGGLRRSGVEGACSVKGRREVGGLGLGASRDERIALESK